MRSASSRRPTTDAASAIATSTVTYSATAQPEPVARTSRPASSGVVPPRMASEVLKLTPAPVTRSSGRKSRT
ncbi:hypothetical protein BJF90_19940 [Pseudonocardia sp. CNS-004]|nr:hypothetical protein BJF90_19940 [Pseudonocardia sp. CNS-004]